MLEFEHVDVAVSRTPILKDISVQFETGKITSIIGPNGCGKTTLLQTLNGISTVTAGKIMLDGSPFFCMSSRERAKHLSFMPQFRDSTPCISVRGLVEHGRFPYMGFSRRMLPEDKQAVQKAMEIANILKYQDCMVNELSGGLQQRVYLAMQLAQDCPYMVMDEPLNYLDFPSKRELYRVIKQQGQLGKTLIMVVHDLEQALSVSDNLLVMQDRRIVYSGTPEHCVEEHIIEGVFDCKLQIVEIDGEKHFVFN